ncbi:multiple cyclophane-containing RiPP AmcA [Streptomyces sp. RPT161]|uniref:multiple cyclophane-containing RiPP AmcA n=1 Tax=Streptomyces sp. RPT161 TaxID=3015993 RepID=UPI0022B938AB|nr:multiple cyclophane-containing RiPP AmcA [Streptomyces sp. RPT161]
MTLLEQLASTDAPVIADLIATHAPQAQPVRSDWGNQPTWDNWNKAPANPWNNQPTWDNWNKKR